MKYISFIMIFLLSGCAVNKTARFRIEYEFIDNPAERRVELHYVNNYERTVCLSLDTWPNSSGAIGFASEHVILRINGTRYHMKEMNTGYCPGCVIKVAPGEKVIGTIPYELFMIPESLVFADKELELIVNGYFCRSSDN